MKVLCISDDWNMEECPNQLYKPEIGEIYNVESINSNGNYRLKEIKNTSYYGILSWDSNNFKVLGNPNIGKAYQPINDLKPSQAPSCPPITVGLPGL